MEYYIVVDGFNQYEFLLFSAGAQELLDSWLTLVSRLANSETLLDSPHSLPATSTALVFVPFEPIRFLVKTQKVRFQGRAPWRLNVKEKKKKEIIFGDAEANYLARGRQNCDLGRMENLQAILPNWLSLSLRG